MTVPRIKEFEVMLREAADLRQAALEVHRQQQRKRAIRIWRVVIIGLVVVGVVAAGVLGVALMWGGR